MKKLFLISIVLFISSVSLSLSAQTRVKGYFKSNGTYVQPHVRSSRNTTNHDNWSTRGNTNPFTYKSGSVARDYSTGAYNFGSGRTIHTGPKGGQYYRNDFGSKTYVPKRTNYGTSYNFNTTTRRSRSSSFY